MAELLVFCFVFSTEFHSMRVSSGNINRRAGIDSGVHEVGARRVTNHDSC